VVTSQHTGWRRQCAFAAAKGLLPRKEARPAAAEAGNDEPRPGGSSGRGGPFDADSETSRHARHKPAMLYDQRVERCCPVESTVEIAMTRMQGTEPAASTRRPTMDVSEAAPEQPASGAAAAAVSALLPAPAPLAPPPSRRRGAGALQLESGGRLRAAAQPPSSILFPQRHSR
jgi:hypothetical protein